MICRPLERSLKDKKIGISYLGVTLEGTKVASIESQVVQEGIEVLKKGKKSNNRSIQEEDSEAKDISNGSERKWKQPEEVKQKAETTKMHFNGESRHEWPEFATSFLAMGTDDGGWEQAFRSSSGS